MNPRFCIFLFLVLMKELGGDDGERGGGGEFRVSLCKSRGEKLFRPS